MSQSDCIQKGIEIAAVISAIAAIISAIFTILIFFVAKNELSRSGKINKEDFSNKIKNDFYTAEMYNLFFLIENTLLEFHQSNNPERFYFKIKAMPESDPFYSHYVNIRKSFGVELKDGIILTYLFDQYLLNHFTDLKNLLDSHILSDHDIYDGFEYYITNTGNNSAIKDYVKYSRREKENSDVFQEFVDLYKSFNNGKSFIE
jgi:hypothetical protein